MPKKILIAEDDGFIAEVYHTKLSFAGYQVSIATDGVEALDKIKAEKPEIVLLDVMMPKMDGLEVLEKLRSMEEYKKLPVIILTNAGEKENIAKAMSLGATDYLIKAGFTPEEVVGKIKKYLP